VCCSRSAQPGLCPAPCSRRSVTFSLELPPYRPPRIWQTLYTSLMDRTIFVLLARGGLRVTGGRRHLVEREPPHRQPQPCRTSDRWFGSRGLFVGLNGVNFAGLHRGHSRQRNHHPHHPHAHRDDHRRPWGWPRRGSNVRTGFRLGGQESPDHGGLGQTLTAVNLMAFQPAAQPLQHDDLPPSTRKRAARNGRHWRLCCRWAWASWSHSWSRSSGGFSADRAKQNRERRQPAHLMAVCCRRRAEARDLALIRIRLPTSTATDCGFILSMRIIRIRTAIAVNCASLSRAMRSRSGFAS